MQERAPDRRVQRTRKLLQEALMALILEKGYEAVTIQDIIDRANVGRATFYNHFLDKQDLLVSGFAELRVSLGQQRPSVTAAGTPRLGFSLGMFEHACRYRPVYRALVGKQSGAIVRKQMQQLLTELVHDELAALGHCNAKAPIPLEMVVEYTVGAFMALLMWCADHDTPETPAEIDAIFQQLTVPGILAGLGCTTRKGSNDAHNAKL